MILRQLGTGYEAKERHIQAGGDETVRVHFQSFGRGNERSPSFDVMLEWKDIEDAIAVLARAKHPGAVRMRWALALADAAEGLAQVTVGLLNRPV